MRFAGRLPKTHFPLDADRQTLALGVSDCLDVKVKSDLTPRAPEPAAAGQSSANGNSSGNGSDHSNTSKRPLAARGCLADVAPDYRATLERKAQQGIHTAIFGPAGTFKTTEILRAADRAGRKMYQVQGQPGLTFNDLRGTTGLKGGDTVFQPGPLLRAVREAGKVGFLLDEANALLPGELLGCFDVLDGRPLHVPETGESVSIPPDFWFVMTWNGGGYAGTRSLNEALRDRFFTIEADYLPPAAETDLFCREFPALERALVQRAVQLANAIRDARKKGTTDYDLSVRTMRHWLVEARDRAVVAAGPGASRPLQPADLLDTFESVVLVKVGDRYSRGPERAALREIAHLILKGSGK